MKRTTSHFRNIVTSVLTTLASGLISSVVLAADMSQNQSEKTAPATIGKSLSLSVVQSNNLLVQQQTRSLGINDWLQLRDQARSPGTRQEPVRRHNRVSNDGTSLSRSRNRFEGYSKDSNRSLAKHLANHLEIDIGRRPSINLRYDFY